MVNLSQCAGVQSYADAFCQLTHSHFEFGKGRSFRYTGCPGRNVPDFGRMFLTLKYTDITQNTYVYPKLNGYGDNGERSLKV